MSCGICKKEDGRIGHCIDCWVRTPAYCEQRLKYFRAVKLLIQCSEELGSEFSNGKLKEAVDLFLKTDCEQVWKPNNYLFDKECQDILNKWRVEARLEPLNEL